jgi:hypothetical protein
MVTHCSDFVRLGCSEVPANGDRLSSRSDGADCDAVAPLPAACAVPSVTPCAITTRSAGVLSSDVVLSARP